ncbi:MAG: hypothetical protein Q8P41_31735 [Pseudomonadota bacterium]|nr:hypothetical protein [Pseudomonadota bacterium]
MSALPDRVPYSGRLVFEEDVHRYRLDGEVIPGITSVLKRAGMIEDGFYSTEARDRGTAVHLAIQYLLEGCLAFETVDPSLLGYVEAFQRFVTESGIEFLERPELLVGSETLRYATLVDGVGRIGRQVYVLNWKSGAAEPFHPVQAAGEAIAYVEAYGAASIWTLGRAALYLGNDGRYSFHEHKRKGDLDDFRAAVRVAHWNEQHGQSARKEN